MGVVMTHPLLPNKEIDILDEQVPAHESVGWVRQPADPEPGDAGGEPAEGEPPAAGVGPDAQPDPDPDPDPVGVPVELAEPDPATAATPPTSGRKRRTAGGTDNTVEV